MHTSLAELRGAVRTLLKTPGVTLVAIAVIALGIGANTAIFSVVNTVLLQPLPYPDPDRLVVINETGHNGGRISVAYPNFLDWKAQAQSFEKMGGYRGSAFILSGIDPPDRILGRNVSREFFEMLGAKPLLGRLFSADDDKQGAAPVAVLGHDSWKTRFGGDAQILGKTLILNDTPVTVVGVLPPSFIFGSRRDEIWVPLAQMPTPLGAGRWALDRGNHQGLFALARLKQGVTQAQAAQEMKAITARLEQQYPKSNSGISSIVESLYELWVGNVRTTLFVLLAAVGFVLVIACANVANLLLARAAARRKEMAIRAALGAGRWQIIRQLLTESVLLSTVAGILGLLLAQGILKALLKTAPAGIPRLADAHIDPWVLAFTAGASLLTGVLFGLVPALHASRLDVTASLKAEDRGATAGRSSHRLRRLFLVGEIAVALLLSTGAGLMIRSLWNVRQVDPGFQPQNLLTLRVGLNNSYQSDEQRIAFYQEALARLRSLPGIQAASTAECLPINGTCWGSVFVIEGRPVPPRNQLLTSQWNIAGEDYFETMGIRRVRGRTFSRFDTAASSKVAVINEKAARQFFPNEDPIGKRVKQGFPETPNPWREIVGVVADVKQNGLDGEQLPEIFLPFAQEPRNREWLVLRTAAGPGSYVPAIRATIRELNKDVPVYSIRPMEELLTDSMAQRSFAMSLLTGFAGVALLLAAAGIYSVIAYSVSQRTKELGIRMALGARRAHVIRMVIGEGMFTAGAGIAAGAVAALGVTRLMRTLLFGVSADDPLSYAGVAVVLAIVALAASYIPARRATQIDPLTALRHE